MPRFHIPHPVFDDELLKIEGTEVRHIRRVLRLRAGDEIAVFDGSEREYKGTIVEEGPHTVIVKVQSVTPSKRESPLEVTLAQSLLKGEKMDYFIQKATELGVKKIIPFFSRRSVPLLEKSNRLKRYHRWERIAIEASKQCGRGRIPEILPLQDFSEMLLMAFSESLRLILWEKEKKRLKEVLKGWGGRKEIFFIVGPEGGFSQNEVEEAQKKGFISVSMGERILKAETASLCLLSILQYEQGDIG